MIKAFTVSILSLFFFSSVQIAFINENTEGCLEKAGLLKLTRDICIKKGTVPGNTGRMGTLSKGLSAKVLGSQILQKFSASSWSTNQHHSSLRFTFNVIGSIVD
jgi:hypothetical protein